MNILFATTRQWNPGDEFILFGAMNLLEETLGPFNPIIYNRNPQTRMTFQNKLEVPLGESKACIDMNGLWGSFKFVDNSHSPQANSLKYIDYIVFAGSPEWRSRSLVPLYEQIINEKRTNDVIYLGMGSTDPVPKFDALPDVVKQCLIESRLITVRDNKTHALLKPVNAIKLPCPGLFSSKNSESPKSSTIGITVGVPCNVVGQEIPQEVFDYTKEIHDLLATERNVEVISHYCQEIELIQDQMKPKKLHYSFDAKDYLNIYKQFGLIVTTRIHGAGIASSLGIPSVTIDHSSRTDTARGFLSEIVSLDQEPEYVAEVIKAMGITSVSERIITHKEKSKEVYLDLLKKAVA